MAKVWGKKKEYIVIVIDRRKGAYNTNIVV